MANKLDTFPAFEQLSEEINNLNKILNEEPDLAVILIGGSFLDSCLRAILEKKFKKGKTAQKLLNEQGALGSFFDRAQLCYVLGIIEKPIFNDLIKIGEIRNIVAHHRLQFDFSNEGIISKCSELGYVKAIDDAQPDGLKLLSQYMSTAKNQFKLTVVLVANRLVLTGLELSATAKNSPQFQA